MRGTVQRGCRPGNYVNHRGIMAGPCALSTPAILQSCLRGCGGVSLLLQDALNRIQPHRSALGLRHKLRNLRLRFFQLGAEQLDRAFAPHAVSNAGSGTDSIK